MEGLKLRIYIVSAVLVLAGALNIYSVKLGHGPAKSEQWMEQRAPDQVAGVGFVPGRDNPEQSYRMDDESYEMLSPYGMVARVYSGKLGAFDTVLIASRSRSSFHDPRVCFSGQGWSLTGEDLLTIDTKTRGKIQVTLTTLTSIRVKSQHAIYFYRGPSGFHATTLGLKWDMFMQRLLGKQDVDGVFYRFIPLDPECSVEELTDFVARYMEAAKESSGGYF